MAATRRARAAATTSTRRSTISTTRSSPLAPPTGSTSSPRSWGRIGADFRSIFFGRHPGESRGPDRLPAAVMGPGFRRGDVTEKALSRLARLRGDDADDVVHDRGEV